MELPHIGDHCTHPNCNILDFLPFTCSLCGNKYCQNHHKYEDHSCAESYKLNVQVPICPLCDKPVPSKKGLAPDVAVNEHLERNCQSKGKKVNCIRCSVSGCRVKELVSIQCDSCKLNFCLRHRHTVDHNCIGSAAARRERTLNGSILKNWFTGRGGSYSRTNANSQNDAVIKTNSVNGTSRPSRILEVSPSITEANVSTFQGNISEEEALRRAILTSQGKPISEANEVTRAKSEDEELARAIALSLQEQNVSRSTRTTTSGFSDCSVS